METTLKTISLGGVNCYLAKAAEGYVLIDTGVPSQHTALIRELEKAGVAPGILKLIVVTHGDSDHAGNCAFLREKYGAKIAMHDGDSGMVEHGDMSWGRKVRPDRMSAVFKIMSFVFGKLVKPGKFDTFTPDIRLEDGQSLSGYGFDAMALHLPGHSKGSMGMLTADGCLYCGDLFYNVPGFSYIDNLEDHRSSVEKLKRYKIEIVYPGHGKPFPMNAKLK